MFGPSMKTSRCQQAWLRAVIFVGLYLMLLLSVTQCALVLYLYGTAQVDGLTTPSLIIGLIASFLSVPFVVIHTILSWQYRRVPGLNMPRNALHMACSHLPRVMVAMWLAASVAGLVVVSKQTTCVSLSQDQQFWKAGMGCQIHRGTVILSILAFCTTSALFFCFQVCERPYDASLLGLYTPQRPPRDGSLFSESSWESETLKNEIFYLCRHPDAGPGNGELYWSPNDSSLFENPVRPPSIRYPGPARVRPQLHINTHTNSVRPSIIATTDTSPKVSPVDETAAGSMSFRSDVSPLSRNPSMTSTLQPGTEAAFTRAPPVPKIPDIPEVPAHHQHKRQKSSVSSRKFLPKDWDMSKPLSEDPQIRALASPPLSPELEELNQEEKDDVPGLPTLPSPPAPARTAPSPAAVKDSVDSNKHIQTRRRSMTAPGNPPPVLPPVPLVVRKSRTSQLNPSSPSSQSIHSIHHPHHPNYTPKPSPPESQNPDGNTRPYTARNGRNMNLNNNNHIDNKRPLQCHKSTARLPPHRQPSIGHHPPRRVSPSQASISSHGSSLMVRDPSQKQRFRASSSSSSFSLNTQFSRHAPPPPPLPTHYQRQHYHHQQQQHMIYPPSRHHTLSGRPHVRRFHSNDGRGFDPARTLPPIPRSDDTATLYPSTRRPRSSTYGGSPSNSHAGLSYNKTNNNNTQEGGSGGVEAESSSSAAVTRQRHNSLSLADGGVALDADREIVDKKNTYRGAERTSICGGL